MKLIFLILIMFFTFKISPVSATEPDFYVVTADLCTTVSLVQRLPYDIHDQLMEKIKQGIDAPSRATLKMSARFKELKGELVTKWPYPALLNFLNAVDACIEHDADGKPYTPPCSMDLYIPLSQMMVRGLLLELISSYEAQLEEETDPVRNSRLSDELDELRANLIGYTPLPLISVAKSIVDKFAPTAKEND